MEKLVDAILTSGQEGDNTLREISQRNNDEADLFFDSCKSRFNKFTNEEKALCRFKIGEVLYHIESKTQSVYTQSTQPQYNHHGYHPYHPQYNQYTPTYGNASAFRQESTPYQQQPYPYENQWYGYGSSNGYNSNWGQ